ncbi:MAG: (Fe-S)-binding protein [Desulfobacterales bacterium]|nr:MAG: (Fe-S)-binding protein [Desulfobacterales bacterium]
MVEKLPGSRDFYDRIIRCNNCGFCEAACPIFKATRRSALNARGKMIILQDILADRQAICDELIETLFQCTFCSGCTTQCPAGVNVPEILRAVRKDMVNIGTCHAAFKGMDQVLDKHPNIYAAGERERFGRKVNQKAEIVFFMGCVGQYREEDAVEAALDVMDHLRVDYTLIEEVCCSGVLEDIGFAIHDDLVRKNVALVRSTGAKALVTGCPYCLRTFKHRAPYQPLRDLGLELLHISQFLTQFDFPVQTHLKVTYHDPCDLARHAGIYEAPRQTIKKIAPNFVELPNRRANSLCCGAGGGVRGAYPRNSLSMARQRLKEVEEVGADILLTECHSCVHNLSNARLRRQKFEIYTTSQFIRRLLEGQALVAANKAP